jgi:transmembrane sensor
MSATIASIDPAQARIDAAARDWVLRLMDSDDDGLGEAAAAWRDADPRHDAAFWHAWRAWNVVGGTDLAAGGDWRAEAAALRKHGRWVRIGWIAAPVAAAASLALVFGLPALRGPAAMQVATRVAETRVVALADGSRVTIGGKSAMKAFVDPAHRKVELESGQAFFEVAHDPAHPFVVVAGDAEITVKGTKFDVRRVGDDVQVSVLEGRVEVRRRGMLTSIVGGSPDAVLTAGQKSELAPSASAFVAAAPVAAPAGEWRTGRLFYADAPLSEIVADAQRYSSIRIRLADASVGSQSLTISYRAGDVDGLEEAIEAALPVRVERKDDELVISGSK